MPVGELCNREVVFATKSTTITEAAQLMRRYHVGDLVVVDEVNCKRIPVGIVTDRDIVIEVVAKSQPLQDCTVDKIMNPRLIHVPESAGMIEAIRLMRAHAIRRIPVVSNDGTLVGILSADDVLDLLAEELSELAKVSPRQQTREIRSKLP
nr:CBS domain-containing protein [uncultured Desulfobulbus sp.]